LAKTDTFDVQMLARFAEGIHPPPRVIPDAQTQKLAGSAGTATPGFGSAQFSPVYLGAGWPCVLQRGPDRRHLYHQQQWQFVTQPFYQISFETSTACCSPGFHVDPRNSPIFWKIRLAVILSWIFLTPGWRESANKLAASSNGLSLISCGRDLVARTVVPNVLGFII